MSHAQNNGRSDLIPSGCKAPEDVRPPIPSAPQSSDAAPFDTFHDICSEPPKKEKKSKSKSKSKSKKKGSITITTGAGVVAGAPA